MRFCVNVGKTNKGERKGQKMIVKLGVHECVGKLVTDKKVHTILEVNNIEELESALSKSRYVDVIVYRGNLDDFINCSLPVDKCKKLMIYYYSNPDIISMDILNSLRSYNVLCGTSSDYHNMEQVYKLCGMFDNIRFCGGYFCNLDGVKLGVFDDKSKQCVFDNHYSTSEDILSLSDLDEQGVEYEFSASVVAEVKKNTGAKKASQSKSTSAKSKTPQVKRGSKFVGGGLSLF